jgi:hypothetical protein
VLDGSRLRLHGIALLDGAVDPQELPTMALELPGTVESIFSCCTGRRRSGHRDGLPQVLEDGSSSWHPQLSKKLVEPAPILRRENVLVAHLLEDVYVFLNLALCSLPTFVAARKAASESISLRTARSSQIFSWSTEMFPLWTTSRCP